MTQPSQPSDRRRSQGRRRPARDAPRNARGPRPAIVGGVLLVIVLLLALGAFFGTRAYLGAGTGGGADAPTFGVTGGPTGEDLPAAAAPG